MKETLNLDCLQCNFDEGVMKTFELLKSFVCLFVCTLQLVAECPGVDNRKELCVQILQLFMHTGVQFF